jgi:hypothetical protein
MKRILHFFERGAVLPATLVASAFVGVFVVFTHLILPDAGIPIADMRIEPQLRIIAPDEMFEVQVVVESSVPVNVFNGELSFDNTVLEITRIDYNTSIADLWAEEPWYENGDGTLKFTGGTTEVGGFSGEGALLTIHFTTLKEGEGTLTIDDAHILEHDGLGTFATLEEPIEALFDVTSPLREKNLLPQTPAGGLYKVTQNPPSTDVNGDGKQSIADVSIFMLNMVGNDLRYDFNLDGEVNTKDLSIILNAK